MRLGEGDTISVCLCYCLNVLIGGSWEATPSFDRLKLTYVEVNYFEPIWFVGETDVLWVVDSFRTNRFFIMTLSISRFAWSFCISKSFLNNALSSLGTREWDNLCASTFGNSTSCSASLSVCLLLLLRYGFLPVTTESSDFFEPVTEMVSFSIVSSAYFWSFSNCFFWSS